MIENDISRRFAARVCFGLSLTGVWDSRHDVLLQSHPTGMWGLNPAWRRRLAVLVVEVSCFC